MIGLALVADLSVDVVRSAVESLADARIVARSNDFVRDGRAAASTPPCVSSSLRSARARA
jgi:hypothetical protein